MLSRVALPWIALAALAPVAAAPAWAQAQNAAGAAAPSVESTAGAGDPGSDATPAAAIALEDAIAELRDKRGQLSPERLDQLAAAIDSARSASGDAGGRVSYAAAQLDAARQQWVAARDAMRALVKRHAGTAEYHAFLGTATFATIGSARDLSTMSLADEGKAAYEKAVELDPALVEPRIGLAQYYIQAPALFGGSYRKAREQADALLALPEGRYQGQLIIAQIAAAKEEWKDMAAAYRAAAAIEAPTGNPTAARRAHAAALLNQKEDPEAALAVIAEAEAAGKVEDQMLLAIKGLSLVKLKRWGEAVEPLSAVLAANPTAMRSRFALATALEKLGTPAEAKVHYEEYLKRFPEGPQASDAKSAIKRIDRAARK